MSGAITGDGEGMEDEEEGERHPPHVRSTPTFQRWSRPWVTDNAGGMGIRTLGANWVS